MKKLLLMATIMSVLIAGCGVLASPNPQNNLMGTLEDLRFSVIESPVTSLCYELIWIAGAQAEFHAERIDCDA